MSSARPYSGRWRDSAKAASSSAPMAVAAEMFTIIFAAGRP
ncbi:hypothetical protein BC477_06635 [Clavibacter michiganensis subsp. michiganensis]|uniref:Uncharacterized protein n=1 Tax=Clavibacter michiganensis subsp. michiganensis TaxID=33013 RepID=A0A251XLN6_CLAMM|nr:hypothetical protein BC477_06635 [Clavibacter michiganensis subsp. michiganensis]OUE04394.1 hypothetical protein CMMCAS07_05565 [Clavibacter michiganensis subsp. michiganensis]